MKKVKALFWAAVVTVFAVAVTTVGKADGADPAAGSEFVKFRFAHWMTTARHPMKASGPTPSIAQKATACCLPDSSHHQ